jgi:hypothetical protein
VHVTLHTTPVCFEFNPGGQKNTASAFPQAPLAYTSLHYATAKQVIDSGISEFYEQTVGAKQSWRTQLATKAQFNLECSYIPTPLDRRKNDLAPSMQT